MLQLRIFKVQDKSMEPGLKDGDYVLVSSWNKKLRPNDIVVLKHPTMKISIIKRINSIKNGLFFVSGDNSSESEDSRNFGRISINDIIGKVIWCCS